ncbi:MAG TPA: UDP-2,3-diacylglucosamine diphosphatase [Gemmatimonadaceae bacterium]|nr:UDP-2,3-diacylglucosamine diphosphatase [Gemmatimonadaceae bacterium]
MRPRPVYIFSDTHLGAAPAEVETAVLAFLRHVRTQASALLINGDLFDFWFEWRSVIPRRGFRVVAALADIQEAGVPVTLIGGNHDCWGGEVLRKDAGISYQLGAWEGTLAGWRARVEHGDGLRPERDRGYRRLRRVLRHPVSVRLFRAMHPDWGTRLASLTSHTSRSRHLRDDGVEIRQIGLELLRSRPDLELLVFGHSHVAALERTPAGGVYANAGAWLDAPTFLRLTEERIELRRWTGSAEGERLHAIDRRPEEALADL